jgi:16S rRNA (cytosine967-C5)-methyltransferase
LLPESLPTPPAADGSGLPPRLLAWKALQAVRSGAYADIALDRALQNSPLGPADRGLAAELTFGCVRQRRLLEAWIDLLGRRPASAQPPKLRTVLELGVYQLLFCQRVPAAAAVHTSVALAQALGLARLAPVVNGQLRSMLRLRLDAAADDPLAGLSLPADPVAAFGLRHSLPDWIAAALLQWLPPERAEAFARAANAPPPLDLRVNRRRAGRDRVLELFAAAGLEAVPLADRPDGLCLRSRAGDIRTLPGYEEGLWSVQDRSAQAIAPLLEPQSGQRLLDACAAPGGKATHLAELMGPEGEVWAVDRAGSRLSRLEANAGRLGLAPIAMLEADATNLLERCPQWRGFFQGILVDAPCSGLGTLARHADARWRMGPESLPELMALQDQLLDAMVPLLAPGGRLVYATCSVHPGENGDRSAAFLERHPGWQLAEARQWWPGEEAGGDGFYAAVLRPPP